MKVADAEEFTQSLGQIVAGSWRQIAWAESQGIPEALGMTTREWVEERLGGYVRLSLPQRREAVAELTEEGMSERAVADVLGVAQSTINNDRKALHNADDSAVFEEQLISSDQRIELLPDDLAERVRSGATELDEAEGVADERRTRIEKYVREVQKALDILSRMVGHPVPSELSAGLTSNERQALKVILRSLPRKDRNDRRRAS